MEESWVKPAFQEAFVNGECTAYAGAERDSLSGEPAAGEPETPIRGADQPGKRGCP